LKKSELRRLVAEYKEIKTKLKKSYNKKYAEKLGEIQHRYYHETGRSLESESCAS
jgi:hypothetical protein